MATEHRKAAKKEKSPRTKVVGVRLDPKLRYLAEIAARKQRRSISSFIEWAIELSLENVLLEDGEHYSASVADEAERLWDVDDADRFAKLALRHPELLTHEEQLIWKLVRENGRVWSGRYLSGIWQWEIEERYLNFQRLREHWGDFVAVAEGEKPFDALPKWNKDEQVPPDFGPEPGFDPDEEMPF